MNAIHWFFLVLGVLGLGLVFTFLAFTVRLAVRTGLEWVGGAFILIRGLIGICVFGAIVAASLGYSTRWLLVLLVIATTVMAGMNVYIRKRPSQSS